MNWNNPWVGIVRFHDLPDHAPWDIETRPPKLKHTRKRRVTLTRAMRQADEAGVKVSGATLNANGSVTLQFGSPNVSEETNEWDTVQ
ncbi:hypothetical protein [Bradyrhizobium tunisiense]|uniref:hypothetical protein n=1 Tax=Bradyrhizobium tunisiense TaxID=3278709 RepID=UPI0035DA8D64